MPVGMLFASAEELLQLFLLAAAALGALGFAGFAAIVIVIGLAAAWGEYRKS